MQWHNIKTAPKDGKVIILYSDEGVIEGRWDSEDDDWLPIKLSWHGCGCCGGDRPEFTHWMPLPELPKKE